jgi:CheY-like chemotaxis protein
MKKFSSVLLVDDDQITNFSNQILLEDMEVTQEVLVALNGLEALNLIERKCKEGRCPQLILLDINMPVMNGFEFLQAYDELNVTCKQSVVVVMLTTSMNPVDVDRLRTLPVNGFLNKPLTEEMVRNLLLQHFGRDLPA